MRAEVIDANGRQWLDIEGRRFPVCTDRRGRRQVYLGKGHPLAYRNGKRWVARVILACKLGKMPPREVHAHHHDRDKANDRAGNIRAFELRAHMRAEAALRDRDGLGRFRRAR
jgi:hypothetical protein